MTYSVEIDQAPAYELLVSLKAFTDRKVHKSFDRGPQWLKQVKEQLGPVTVRDVTRAEESLQRWPGLILLVWQCPGERDAAGFVQWLGRLTPGDIYELLAPYLSDGQTLPRDLAALRDRVVHALGVWHERYFRHVSPALLGALVADAAARQDQVRQADPVEAVEQATGGLWVEPVAGLERVLLIPQVHAAPINLYDNLRGLLVSLYPVDLPPADPTAPPPGLLRLTRALGDESRLRMLRLLAADARSFTDVLQHANLAKSTVHHHLVVLRASGLVRLHWRADGSPVYSMRPGALDRLRLLLGEFLEPA